MKLLTKLLLFLILPLCMYGSTRQEFLQEFVDSFSKFQTLNGERGLFEWRSTLPEDSDIINVCGAFLALADGECRKARNLFESSFDKFYSMEEFQTPLQQAEAIFYSSLDYLESDTFFLTPSTNHIKFHNPYLWHCKAQKEKGWRIKSVVGVIVFAGGLFVSCFEPGIGAGLLTTGAGLIVDGTAGGIDEIDRMDALRRQQEQELKNSSFPYAIRRKKPFQGLL